MPDNDTQGVFVTHVFVGPGDGEVSADPVGYPQRTLTDAAPTRSAFSLHEMMKPPGEGPPPHIHGNMEEAFYVLEGEFTFAVGSEEIVAAAGSFLLVSRGTMHSFWNSGSLDGRYLRFFSPALTEDQHAFWVNLGERVAAAREREEGTTHELFFREVSRPQR